MKKPPRSLVPIFILSVALTTLAQPLDSSKSAPVSEPAELRGLVNVTPRCTIQGYPYLGVAARRALNGFTLGSVSFEKGIETGGEILFGLPQPMRVEAIRFYQGVPESGGKWSAFARSYLIQGRSAGGAKWDKILARVQGAGQGGWVTHPVAEGSAVPLEAVRFVALEGEVGYRTAFPAVGKFEIYIKADEAAKLPSPPPSGRKENFPEEPGWSPLAVVEEKSQILPDLRHQLMRGVFIEPWMFDWKDWDPVKGPLTEHPPFQKMMEDLRAMKVNTVWLYPPDARGSGIPNELTTMIYPSKVTRGMEKNVLTPFCEAMHAAGIRVIVMWMASIPPFSTEPWQFPLEESSRFPKAKQFENVLYGDFFREKFGALMLEALGLGADGVALFPDEYYYKGPNLPLAPDNQTDQPMVAAFKRDFGYDAPPPEIEDSRQYRAWVLLQYQGLANLAKQWCVLIGEKFPNAYRATNISIVQSTHNLGIEHGLAYDLIGHAAKLDGFGTDPYFGEDHWWPPAMTKRMTAAQPILEKRRPMMVIQANQWSPNDPVMQKTYRPVWSYATPISVIAHGGGGVGYYRLNYLTDDPRYARNAAKAFGMCQFLDSRGFYPSVVPPNVALLDSRAGQDWWQLKMQAGSAGSLENGVVKKEAKTVQVERVAGGGVVTAAQSSRAQLCERIRGHIHHKVIMERLFEECIPFNQFQLDHPGDLIVLKDYRLAILPFPYSIPKESVAALEKAVQGGLKLLIIRQQGETDPLGEPYPEGPRLATLIRKYPQQAQFWEDDLMAQGSLPDWIAKFKRFVDQAVGNAAPIRVEKEGDVEVAIRETSDGKRFVFLINWDLGPQAGVVKFPGAKGACDVEEIDFSEEDPLQRRSRGVIEGDVLQKGIPFSLKSGEVRCWLMTSKAGNSDKK